MANIRGTFDTKDYASNMVKLDIRDKIFELQPEATPFITILSKMRKEPSSSYKFSWFEDDLLGNYTQVDGAAATADTTITVDDASPFQENDLLKETSTDEVMLITNVNSGANQLTVQRAFGQTAATTASDNDYLYKLGSAMQEGWTAPDSLVTQKNEIENYIQSFSKTVELTEQASHIDTYGGDRRAFEQAKKGVELKREIEAQLLWGEKYQDTSGTHPRRQTSGIYYLINTNAPTLNMSDSALTESAFEEWLKDVFNYDSSPRYLFTGPLVLYQISQFASGKQRLEPGRNKKYGISVTTYHSTLGDVHLVNDRHFTGPHAGKGLALKMDEVVYRYLKGEDWTLKTNIQSKDSHSIKDEYYCSIGLETHHDKLHGILKGVA